MIRKNNNTKKETNKERNKHSYKETFFSQNNQSFFINIHSFHPSSTPTTKPPTNKTEPYKPYIART